MTTGTPRGTRSASKIGLHSLWTQLFNTNNRYRRTIFELINLRTYSLIVRKFSIIHFLNKKFWNKVSSSGVHLRGYIVGSKCTYRFYSYQLEFLDSSYSVDAWYSIRVSRDLIINQRARYSRKGACHLINKSVKGFRDPRDTLCSAVCISSFFFAILNYT